jgi:hypothetical protein
MEGTMTLNDLSFYGMDTDEGYAKCKHPKQFLMVTPTIVGCKLCGQIIEVAH